MAKKVTKAKSESKTEKEPEATTGAEEVNPTPEPEVAGAKLKGEPVINAFEAIDHLGVHPADSPAIAIIRSKLSNYHDHMRKVVPVDPAVGAGYQVDLYDTIRSALYLDGDEFNKAWLCLVNVFRQYEQTTFNMRLGYRFMDQVVMSKADRKTFERLMNLLLTTAAAKSVASVGSQVDMERTVQYIQSEDHRQKLRDFYNVE